MKKSKLLILIVSVILVTVTTICGLVALYTPGFYQSESQNWQIQAKAQDLVNLIFVCPWLMINTYFLYKEKKQALFIHGGISLYLIYTFTIYCFDIHFNRLFLLYCASLGLSLFLFISILHWLYKSAGISTGLSGRLRISTGIYFTVISILFSIEWLSEIIAANIHNATPPAVTETGLFTNPVHVLDLSVFLPGIFITGILLLYKKRAGFIFTPVFLSFSVLLYITVAFLSLVLKINGNSNDLTVFFAGIVLAVISAWLLALFSSRKAVII